ARDSGPPPDATRPTPGDTDMSRYASLSTPPAAVVSHGPLFRWGQLVMGIVCMAMIANLQYGWTLFVNPIADKYGWTRAAIQVAFNIFVPTATRPRAHQCSPL